MLEELGSDDSRFRTVKFNTGLNVLLAEKVSESAVTDTRNSVGKSSMIEVLHFLMGASADKSSIFVATQLKHQTFYLKFAWPSGARLKVSRSGQNTGSVQLERWLDSDYEPVGQLALADWNSLIEAEMFHIPAGSRGISGRAMLSFAARRISSSAFNEPTRFYPRQAAAEGTTNLAYLLGLDWSLAARYRDLTQRESARRALRRAAQEPMLDRIVGKVSELRGQIAVRERRVEELRSEIEDFSVLPAFEERQSRADQIARIIASSRHADQADRANLNDITSVLASTSSTVDGRLQPMLEELGGLLRGQASERFAQVAAFHNSVIRNRRRYLEQELAETQARLVVRSEEREELALEQRVLLKELDSGGALSDLLTLQAMHAQEVAGIEVLQARFEAARALEASQTEIKKLRSGLVAEVTDDINEREETVKEATLLFNDYSSRLYRESRESYLEILPGTSSLEIRPHIDTDDGHGVRSMVIFCFDLTVAVLARRANRGADFLIHDSHLFDGVDARQIGLALFLAAEVCREEGLQYIASLNSDDLEKVEAAHSSNSKLCSALRAAVISPVLSDVDETAGLFGIRI